MLQTGDALGTPACSICRTGLDGPDFARNYPNLVCRGCDDRALNKHGRKPCHDATADDGDNPVFIDGIKCWRRYRFGGFIAMRDMFDCRDLAEFYQRHIGRP